jgi:hypothetical protein
LSNGTRAKEDFMKPFNQWLDRMQAKVDQLLEKLAGVG